REFAYEVEVERKALQNALKAAAPFIRDSNHHIELESVTGLTVDGERESALELVGVSVDRGNVHYEIVATLDEDMPRTALNAEYLAAVAGAIGSDTLTIAGNGPNTPIVVSAPDRANVRSLIMPVILRDRD